MPTATHYTQLTRARLASEVWDEAYFALIALKGVLQSCPGYVSMELLGRAESDEVDILTIVRWALEEQLEAWLERGETPQDVLKEMEPPPRDLRVEYLLEMG